MVKLTPEQQRLFIRKAPSVFKRYNGVWGERGATNVLLELATKRVLRVALDAARENVAIRTKRNRA
jgi:hypothetical protein